MAKTAEKVSVRDFQSPHQPTWCPGCGDFAVLNAVRQALVDLNIAPHEVMLFSGIGCGSKITDYIHANGFHTIHGRPLPVATGFRLVRPDMPVLVVDGDGDAYGIGGNHLMHTMRRNIDLTHVIENNQIYALTKGQYSPTSEAGFETTTSPEGALEEPVLPTRLAFAGGATFVARGFAGEPKHLASLIARGMEHAGYALIDVLQPCVTFNRLNTYGWYKERIVNLDENEDYDPSDPGQAWEQACLWGDQIPTGVIFENRERPSYEERVPAWKQRETDEAFIQRSFQGLSEKQFDSIKEAYRL